MKERLTISVDADLAAAVAEAVADGRAESVSAWVGEAIREHVAKERRLAALAELISDYEAEHGEITDQEMAEQARADRDAAAAVRAGRRRSRGAA
jgi:Arc/MetJ-type ribon-helix-helix transcriptional regulator